MNEFYWELRLRDGTKILIPPEHVATIRQKMEAGENIQTSRQVIPPHQIIGFEQTSKRKAEPNLIEQAAQAFNEPVIVQRELPNGNKEDAVVAKWVKKEVTQREWEKYYAPHGYKRLHGAAGVISVAFALPVHQIDTNKVQYCSQDEIKQLTS